jgi:hypothetical protein
MSGNGRDLLGNSMIKKLEKEGEATPSMDGQEHVHYSSQQKYTKQYISYPNITLLTPNSKHITPFLRRNDAMTQLDIFNF